MMSVAGHRGERRGGLREEQGGTVQGLVNGKVAVTEGEGRERAQIKVETIIFPCPPSLPPNFM